MTTKRTAAEAFAAKKAEIDALLSAMTAASADHFGQEADAINWGHVTTLDDIRAKLAEAIAALA